MDTYDQNRLQVNLEKAVIDDINNQINTKKGLLSRDVSYTTFNTIVENMRTLLYSLSNWINTPSWHELKAIIFQKGTWHLLCITIIIAGFIILI